MVEELARSFASAGHRLYLVGGVVRDLLLGSFTAGDDIDLTTDAEPRRIRELLRPHATDLWAQGERFGTIGARVRGRAVEVTTHRAEAYDPTSRKPVVTFGRSIVDDLSRRDFTINAMALSLPDRVLSDPFGGEADLAAKVLRTPLSPAESFTDDPLRMLRAARFLPRFDLTAEPGLEAAATELAPRLGIVSVERIRDELERLLAVADPSRGVAFLERTGLLALAVPALALLADGGAQSAALAAAPGPVVVRRAGLVAPLGPEAARQALSALRYPTADVTATVRLVEALPAVLSSGADPETVRRVVDRVGLHRVPELAQLATNMAGAHGASPGIGLPSAPDDLAFFACYRELAATEDLTDLGPPLTGRQIMDHLGLDPGPLVGDVLDRLRHRRLAVGPFGPDDAFRLLDTWVAEGAVAGGRHRPLVKGHIGPDEKTTPRSG